MRYLIPVLATAAIILSSSTASADLGDQLFKLLANDGAEGDRFGFRVAISGTTAIIGAVWDDDNGSQSGSAYLFDITTGKQITKLLSEAVLELRIIAAVARTSKAAQDFPQNGVTTSEASMSWWANRP